MTTESMTRSDPNFEENYRELFADLEHQRFALQDEISMLKRKIELMEERYRYAIRKLKMIALELDNE